jgi:acetoacetyl-CoA synthetase
VTLNEGDLLWEPSEAVKAGANLTDYMGWLAEHYGIVFDDYPSLWQWSVTEIEQFWESMWRYFEIQASTSYSSVIDGKEMPGAKWFGDARLNYAENIFRNMTAERPALIYKSETEPMREISWQELYDKTRIMAHTLRELGVKPGDRVTGFMPHIPETIAALLACASIGAIWSSSSPDFGGPSVLDRFSQIEPKVLIAVDGYVWNGKVFDRRAVVVDLQNSLPSLEKTILVTLVTDGNGIEALQNTVLWDEVLAATETLPELTFEQLPFNHPLWVLYSSGTTGLPKPIVHGQGGIILEHLKAIRLHLDLKPGERFFWYTNTGWMMWNFLVGGLLNGNIVVIYNGSPGYPNLDALWAYAEQAQMHYFGTAAAFVSACIKGGVTPNKQYDLSRIKAVGSTGSPLSLAGFSWIYENVNSHLALESFSGGTDLCTGFVGGCRLQPIYAGEIQVAMLGAKVQAFNEAGDAVIDEVGELVITEPAPSMPLFFWNDANNQRYRESYFGMYPGIWRHGDWIKINERGGCVIYGRSDSTINRQGIRMGTSEIYQAVESLPEVIDCLVIDLEALGRESYMPMFVVLRDGVKLDEPLVKRIKQKVRQDISPRHVPNDVFAVKSIPYTLSGKKMEVPIRKILLGQPAEKAANKGAMRNPEAIAYFVELAERLKP